MSRTSNYRQRLQLFMSRPALTGMLIAAAAVFSYIPAMRAGFIWDDDAYVTENATLRTHDGLPRIWLEIGSTPQYYPLVFTTFWVEYRLWKLHPAGYHVSNILLHAAVSVLFWRVLRCLAVPWSCLAALMFAVHPIHVESVAWITERKNVLSSAFYLSAMWAYFRFRPLDDTVPSRPVLRRYYALAFVLFFCALFSKTITCSLPAAIAVVIWWRRGRLRLRDLAPLIPMLFVGVAMGLITVISEKQHVGAVGDYWSFTFVERCLRAEEALWFYLGKLVWPTNLTFIYPKWSIDVGNWRQYVLPLAVVGTLGVLWMWQGRLGRGPLATALLFGGTLLPALGFFDVYPMRYSYVADHFQYLASLTPHALLAAAVGRCLSPGKAETSDRWVLAERGGGAIGLRAFLPAGYVVVLAFLTWNQAKIYADSYTLWSDTLAKNPTAAIAYNHLAMSLMKQGRFAEAEGHFRKGLELCDHADTRLNLGTVRAAQGDMDEAILQFQESIRLDPERPDVPTNWGTALSRKGRWEESVGHFQEAHRIDPTFMPARLGLGCTLISQQRYDEAIEVFRESIRQSPENLDAHLSLATILQALGNTADAMVEYRQILQLDPNHPEARRRLYMLLSKPSRP